MGELIILAVSMLPAVASFRGKGGVWQFLALMFCAIAAWGALISSIPGSFFVPWVIAWIFAGIAQQGRSSTGPIVISSPPAQSSIAPAVTQTSSAQRDDLGRDRSIVYVILIMAVVTIIFIGIWLALGIRPK